MAYGLTDKKGEYSRVYNNFRGVDRDGDGSNVSPERLSHSINVWRDYESDGAALESVPGFRIIARLGGKIHGIFSFTSGKSELLLIHKDTELYLLPIAEIDTGTPKMIFEGVAPTRSTGFFDSGCYYLLDGEGIIKITEDAAERIGESSESIYVPTTYVDGEEYEQPNLITRKFKEKFTLGDANEYAYATPDLIYEITDPVARHCALCGAPEGFFGEVDVPSRVLIGGEYYKVKEIARGAFLKNVGILSLRIAEGVEIIGESAFSGCQSLTHVSLPDSCCELGNSAFAHCYALASVYLGSGIAKLGTNVFELDRSLAAINYPLDEVHFKKIENYASLVSFTVNYFKYDRSIYVEIPIFTGAEEILSVMAGEENLSFDTIHDDTVIRAISVLLPGGRAPGGKPIEITAKMSTQRKKGYKSASFLDTGKGKSIGGFDAVTKCRVAARHEGRIFLSGMASLADTVFFSERGKTGENEPLYFGAANYLTLGTGEGPTVAISSIGEAVLVYKLFDDGEGSVFYLNGADGEGCVQRYYYPTSAHAGISTYHASVFFDEPVFLSGGGLFAITQQSLNKTRSIEPRSHTVNRDLYCEDLKSAMLSELGGYLALCTGKRIYLADPRKRFKHDCGAYEYEWFIIDGVGTYRNDSEVFRYASEAPSGYGIKGTDGVAEGTVFSEGVAGGEQIYYVTEGDKRYAVYKTNERAGGDFMPALIYHGVGGRLFFGTEGGDVCVFNNDMRGKISGGYGTDRPLGTQLAPEYYSFAGHAVRYLITTASDNVGIPHLEKNTTPRSLTVKCRASIPTRLHVEVGTDKRGYTEAHSLSLSTVDFGALDFSALTLDTRDYLTLPFREKEKRWVEKAVTVWCEGYCTPIAIYSVAYRYTICGRVKDK